MLDGIFASLYTTSVTVPMFLAVCLLSVALGFGIALAYRKISGEGGTMVSALTVLPFLVQLVILLVNGNLGAGVAVAGARERDIRVTVTENLDYSTLFSDLFAEHTTSYKLLRVKTVNMGSLYSLHYRVTLKDTSKEKELLDAMRCRNGNLEISCGIAADGRQGDML